MEKGTCTSARHMLAATILKGGMDSTFSTFAFSRRRTEWSIVGSSINEINFMHTKFNIGIKI